MFLIRKQKNLFKDYAQDSANCFLGSYLLSPYQETLEMDLKVPSYEEVRLDGHLFSSSGIWSATLSSYHLTFF